MIGFHIPTALITICILGSIGFSIAGLIFLVRQERHERDEDDAHEHVRSQDEVFYTGIQWTPQQLSRINRPNKERVYPPSYGKSDWMKV